MVYGRDTRAAFLCVVRAGIWFVIKFGGDDLFVFLCISVYSLEWAFHSLRRVKSSFEVKQVSESWVLWTTFVVW